MASPRPNLPKAVLRSPGLTEGIEEAPITSTRISAKFQEALQASSAQAVNEIHQNRMKNLRKELDFLKETEWKFDPIEKYIGQTF